MDNPQKFRLLIVAASARPWIHSAEIAGFDVTAFDFFRDWDSRGDGKSCDRSSQVRSRQVPKRTVVRLRDFEDLLLQENLELISGCDLAIVAGGLENKPSIIESLASHVPVLGPDARQLARLSDTVKVLAWLKAMGYQVPESSSQLGVDASPGDWLKKSFRSSSGLGIQRATDEDVGSEVRSHYFQKEVQGENFSGVFISMPQMGKDGGTALVGWTRQLVNEQWCGAGEFRYCGSIGPLPIQESLKAKIETIGRAIAEQYGIVGAWGIDFLVDGSNVWPVDFNIRLTASMEIIDGGNRDTSTPYSSVVDLHVLACLGNLDMQRLRRSTDLTGLESDACFGKSIVFYDGDDPVRITEAVHRQLVFQWRLIGELEPGQIGLADIPNEGELIRPGQPICTILVKQDSHRVVGILKLATDRIRQTLLQLGSGQ
ncbi:MAG: ATP-grasp domain-containing protein [Planctomycetaceae bacterium]|nr:ATP-grasp domain-containing protein [Planctomycetaceae bacterium]